MRKLFYLLFFISVPFINLFAQDEVTKFLGIPVDGSKSAMIQKLKSKGFKYNTVTGRLEGEFNGYDVNISVVTNNNKVYRIFIQDKYYCSESSIRIRYNNLCRQFEKNKRYVPATFDSQSISSDEDISYEMIVHDRRYDASFFQLPENLDTTALKNEFRDVFYSKYQEKLLDELSEEEQQEFIKDAISYILDNFYSRVVWFTLDERYGEYGILMYYDNNMNNADGEDL